MLGSEDTGNVPGLFCLDFVLFLSAMLQPATRGPLGHFGLTSCCPAVAARLSVCVGQHAGSTVRQPFPYPDL